MYKSVQREIPEFLWEHFVYCDTLMLRKNKLCFLLTKNLKFYEFQRKQLQCCLDLNETHLKEVQEEFYSYKGPRGKYYAETVSSVNIHNTATEESGDGNKLMETTGLTSNNTSSQENPISFGKYFYTVFEYTKLYIILQCWDKLLVIHRQSDDAAGCSVFKLVAEFENVANYKIVNGSIKFQAVVEILFENAEIIHTDFQDKDPKEGLMDNTTSITKRHEFKQLIDRMQSARTELQLHKSITQRAFDGLRNTQTFGKNFVRSFNLQEKHMLARYGDIWMRFTVGEGSLVMGIPVVNNCTAPNLTVLQNLKPILKINEDSLLQGLNYTYKLYHLKTVFEDLDTLETFFQSEDELMQMTSAWSASAQAQLEPGTFGVMLLKFPISQIIALNCCPLFVHCEFTKNFQFCIDEGSSTDVKTFELEIFLKNIMFPEILSKRQEYEINFKECSLHQDLLATAFSSVETKLQIKFSTAEDKLLFQHLLGAKFDLEFVQRSSAPSTPDKCLQDMMEVELEECSNVNEESNINKIQQIAALLGYNKKFTSMWCGLLALQQTHVSHNDYGYSCSADAELNTIWKFYTRNNENTFLFIKLLFEDMLLHKVNVDCIEHLPNLSKSSVKLIEFENALRQEVNALIDLIVNNTKYTKQQRQSKYEEIAKKQFESDLIIAKI